MRVPKWALLMLAALIGGFLLGGATARDSSLFGPTVASWVQAVGGVAAIFASAGIAISIDRKSAERREFEQSLQAGIDNSAGRRAVITARDMLQSVNREASQLQVQYDPTSEQTRRWSRRLTVAAEQLAFHVDRGRIEADVAFAAIYARQEVLQAASAWDSYGRGPAWPTIVLSGEAHVAEINELIAQLDAGVLGL